MTGGDMRSEFIPVLGMPTHVMKYGEVNMKDSDKKLVLIIPGYPGVAHAYDEFAKRLYHLTNIPIWTMAHAGHVEPPKGGNQQMYDKLSNEVCTLKGQTGHKLAFINENIPEDVKLILICHSVGCYIVLKILGQLNHTILRCFMLFPALESMTETPRGKRMVLYSKFGWIIILAARILNYLPAEYKLKLVQFYYRGQNLPKCVLEAVVIALNPFAMRNFLISANDSFLSVKQLNIDSVEENLDKLSFYLGPTDFYFPKENIEKLLRKFPSLDMKLCADGIRHDFIFGKGVIMADKLADWFRTYMYI